MKNYQAKNRYVFCCCALLAMLQSIIWRLLPIELSSLLYAIFIFIRHNDMWLCLAKYHGFAINMCLLLLLTPLLRNLQHVFHHQPSRVMRRISHFYRRLRGACLTISGGNQDKLQRHMHDHEFYSYRLLFSAVLHTLVHVLRVHPFNYHHFTRFQQHYHGLFFRLFAQDAKTHNITVINAPPDNRYDDADPLSPTTISIKTTKPYLVDYPELMLVYDRWTVTGYLLLGFFLMTSLLGLRLMQFLAKHSYVLLAHRIMSFLIILLLLPPHHSNYFFIVLPVLLIILDYVIGVYVLTYSAHVRRVLIYPGVASVSPGQGQGDEVLEIDFCVISNRFAKTCQPGDYIAVKIPQISHWQWHPFTVMTHHNMGYGEDTCASRYNLRGIAMVRRKIIVRCVGKWTRAILNHRNDSNLKMWIKGPYTPRHSYTVADILSKKIDRLVFISTGTAITHHLSLLNGLIDEYWLRETTLAANSGFDQNSPAHTMPQEIRLVWIVRHSTDVNFAIGTLNATQLLLSQRGMDGLLTYDIWVTREPTLNERELNTRLQSYLSSSLLREQAGYNANENAPRSHHPIKTRPLRRNQIISLQGGLNDVRRQLSFSLTHPAQRRASHASSPAASVFDFFYANTAMHTGVRPSWNRLRTLCTLAEHVDNAVDAGTSLSSIAAASKHITVTPSFSQAITIDSKPTLVLLNTSVKRLRLDVEQLAVSCGFELLAEGLWN